MNGRAVSRVRHGERWCTVRQRIDLVRMRDRAARRLGLREYFERVGFIVGDRPQSAMRVGPRFLPAPHLPEHPVDHEPVACEAHVLRENLPDVFRIELPDRLDRDARPAVETMLEAEYAGVQRMHVLNWQGRGEE